MGKRERPRTRAIPTYEQACDLLASALNSDTREDILDRALKSGDRRAALERLRAQMRSHVFRTSSGSLALDAMVRDMDKRTRAEGFHVLLEWDHAYHRFLDDEVPVLMLNYFARMDVPTRPLREALAILLDLYFVYILALLLMRAWDEGDTNRNVDRITELLGYLQGPQGSGQRFVDDAEALLFIAISHYEPDDLAYHHLLRKVWELDEEHLSRMAVITGPVFGSHLRWGFSGLYDRDLVRMRDDNFSDYPWVFFAVVVLMKEYARMRERGVPREEREELVGALLNGLTPDPWGFMGEPPDSVAEFLPAHVEFQELYRRYREDLLEEFQAHRPLKGVYSPLGFHFNFPHNALIAMVVIGLLGEGVPNLSLNTLFKTERPGGPPGGSPEALARRMTAYAGEHPEHRSGRRVLMIAYDTGVAMRTYNRTMGVLRRGIEKEKGSTSEKKNPPAEAASGATAPPPPGA